jgi:hypothetical protein
MQISEETMKTLLRRALDALGVTAAGRPGDPYRWSSSDLATDLAPLLVEEMLGIVDQSPRERIKPDKKYILTQMPCGCPVGSHPPGPCGITGFGQEV